MFVFGAPRFAENESTGSQDTNGTTLKLFNSTNVPTNRYSCEKKS